jgi:hypothetical protein
MANIVLSGVFDATPFGGGDADLHSRKNDIHNQKTTLMAEEERLLQKLKQV